MRTASDCGPRQAQQPTARCWSRDVSALAVLGLASGALLAACAAAGGAAPKGAAESPAYAVTSVKEQGAGAADQEGTAAGAEPGVGPARPTATTTGWATPPPDHGERALATLEQAEAELARNELALGRGVDDARAQATQQSGPTEATCIAVCQALDSMRRAVNGICRLAGDPSERCDRARSTLGRSEVRVQDSGCTCTAE